MKRQTDIRPTTRTWLLVGIGAVIIVLVANAIVAIRSIRELHEDSLWVAHTHEVLSELNDLVAALRGAESAERGYTITGDAGYLDRFDKAISHYDERITRIGKLTADNALQQERIARLRELVAARIDALAQTIAARKTEGFEAAQRRVQQGEGRQLMDDVQALAGQMQLDERHLLDERQRTNQVAYRSALSSILVAALLDLIAFGALLWLLRTHLISLSRGATAIHQQRELLSATLLSIGDGVIATDAAGHVTFLNAVAQKLTGWSDQEARDRPLESIFHIVNETTREPVENPALRALREGKITGLANHTILLARDGTEWPIDDSAAPIRSRDGVAVGAILVFREISERKRQEDELRQWAEALKESDRRKTEFLATLAHELRNPLAPISNALQLWPLVENDRQEMERLREMMERQVHQITRLIDDLMDVSRISRGRVQLRVERLDLGMVISGCVESIQPFLDSREHKLTVTLPNEPVFINGDVGRLSQVFGNILHNAAKYTGRNGDIRVTLETRDKRALVRIRDNGPGIPAPMLSAIFDMFRQVDQTLDRSFGGLGIGLTIVKRLIELHGGTVEARSEGVGKGSEFIVGLPLLDTEIDGHAEATSHGALAVARDVPRHRVLVVDDVQASAKTLAMMLNGIGQEVTVSYDGSSAIEQVLKSRPDVVFLDIAMPGMNGYEVARRLRQQADRKRLTLVALTGYGQDEDRRRAIEAGFDHHLIKPTSIDELAQLLQAAACARAQRRRRPGALSRGVRLRPVVFEPGEHPLPAVLGLLLAVRGAVIGIEPVRRVGVEDDFRRLFRVLERGAHLLDGGHRNAGVGSAVEAQHGGL